MHQRDICFLLEAAEVLATLVHAYIEFVYAMEMNSHAAYLQRQVV
ncbi:RNA polymerase subunit sigma-70 [Vibrio tarriae]|nr:RNA polymerase subunit sigma-70 [Vibrio tarriae]